MTDPMKTGKDDSRRRVLASHERARLYGVDPSRGIPQSQPHLSKDALSKRQDAHREFLDAASLYIREIQRTMDDPGFISATADRDGYILDFVGESAALKERGPDGDVLGTRWTEQDVGTSAISMALRHKMPMQIDASDHYREQAQKNACSAAPIFDQQGDLVGVIAVSGKAEKVHPHTLGMVFTAARAIENHMRISRASKELLLRNDFMKAIIESIDSGVMAVDKQGQVIQINEKGKQILKSPEKLVSVLKRAREGWQDIITTGAGYRDREMFIKTDRGNLHLLLTARSILDASGRPEGVIFVFNEINRIRKLVHQMAGTQAVFTFEDIIGVSPSFQEAIRLANIAAEGKSTVLLNGESGTGKELFAQAIHNRSQRKNQPFMAINCGAIPHELLESELFGYAEGAFTGAKSGGRPGKLELADGGTVFLDEVCDMPADMQVKLLRALQSGEVFRIGQSSPISVDIRIIAASQYDLHIQVSQGNFREDLFYRLNVLPIDIPPLRARRSDILLLADHFLRRWSEIMGKPGLSFSTSARAILAHHDWPGNVRELQNLVERAVNLAEGPVIEPAHFGPSFSVKRSVTVKPSSEGRLEAAEKQTIVDTLEETGYNISQTAVLLGTTRATLYKRLKKYGMRLSRPGV